MEVLTCRTEPTFRYLILGIRYFFGIPNTDVSISIVFFLILDIASVFSVYRPMTSVYCVKDEMDTL